MSLEEGRNPDLGKVTNKHITQHINVLKVSPHIISNPNLMVVPGGVKTLFVMFYDT